MLPYYRILIDHIRKLGCDLIIVDSDGDVTELIPLFISVGVNAMLPFEVQAGMDVTRLRKIYGRDLAMIGGLDKRVLALRFSDIEDEINRRLSLMLDSGGYIPSLDHTVPPDVSLDHFRYYIDKVRSLNNL
jgi:uroporphyrinogen decarboxylase